MSRPAPALRRSLVAPGTRWNEAARRYISPDGRFLSDARLFETIEREVARIEQRAVTLAERYRAGALTRPEFQEQAERLIRRANQAGAALGRGGFAQMSRADKDWTRARTREQLGFFREMLAGIARTKPEALDGRFTNSIRQYARASRSTEREMVARIAQQHGAVLYVRVLGAADHCRSKGARLGCIEAARRGPVPRERRIPHGGCTCRNNCRCTELTNLDLARMDKDTRARMERAMGRRERAA